MTTSTKTLLVNAFCALTFYSYGTAMMDYFLVYPSRAIIAFIILHNQSIHANHHRVANRPADTDAH